MTPTESAILEALATYRFLTTEQFLRLGVAKNARYIQQVLSDMSGLKSKENSRQRVPDGPALIHGIEYGREGTGARIHRYWHLTAAGGDYMSVTVPAEPADFKATHLHRRRVIDLHIAAREWAHQHDQRMEFFLADFWEKPKIQRLQPDAVFRLVEPSGNARLFAAEVYCDDGAGRPTRKLERYIPYLDTDAIEKKFNHTHGAVFVLALFTEAIEALVRTQLRLGEFAKFFYFRTLPRTGGMGDFHEGWRHVDGTPVALFPLPGSRRATNAA